MAPRFTCRQPHSLIIIIMTTAVGCSVGDMVILSPLTKRNHNEASHHTVNPFHVLQVRHDATVSEIQYNYRRLALWHHPGRNKACHDDELQRRALVFYILAKCYETLVYHRSEYNACFHNMDHPSLKGEIHVGGKRMMVFGGSIDEDYEVVPTLLKSSTEDDSQQDGMKNGPLAIMYRARHYEPFTDPYDVFDNVFGHSVFTRPPQQQEPSLQCLVLDELVTTPSPAIWTESIVKGQDGTVVSVKSRTLGNRKVTRTETTTVDSSGQRRVDVKVSSEEICSPEEENHAIVVKQGCQSCCQSFDVVEESSFCSWPEALELRDSTCGWRLFPSASAE